MLQAADRANLAILMNEKTFLGEILTSIAEHFATILEELPEETDSESKIGVASSEIQDLLATWMSFDIEEDYEENEGEEYEGEEYEGEEDGYSVDSERTEGEEDAYHAQLVEDEYNEAIGYASDYSEEDAVDTVQEAKEVTSKDVEVTNA